MASGYAVVTGASGAIGSSIARACANAGFELCLVCRNEEAVTALVNEYGARVITGDLAQTTDLERLAHALQDLKEATLLVHAAGRFHQGGVAEVSVEDLDSLFAVNVRAAYVLTRALARTLRSTQGQIVFLNSSAGVRSPRVDNGPYALTKYALRALADAVRAEENAHGVRVVSVYPGRTAGRLQAQLHAAEGRPYVPGSLMQPDDVATVIMNTLALPRTAEVTDVHIRPMRAPAP